MRQSTIDLLLNHEKLIAHVAHSFSQTMSFPADELISFGRSVVIQKASKWDESRGKFSTFVYCVLRSSFTDYIRKQRKEVFVDEFEDTVPAPETYSPLPCNVRDLLSTASADACRVVQIAIDGEWNENWKNLKTLLARALASEGWEQQRIDTAFEEVASYVRTW